MSYILEALKKSQQERDLGQVPTLETLPAIEEATGPPSINLWGVAAVFLAGLATIIALYAAFREVPNTEVASPSVTPSTQFPPVEPAIAPTPPRESPRPPEIPSEAPPEPPAEETPPTTGDEPSPEQPVGAAPQIAEPVSEPPRTESRPPPPIPPPEQDKVPDDLRREIETFKQNFENERSGKQEPAAKKVPPEELRLPREVKERLPAFLMTVHIYDKDPSKRRVHIDARKLREGAETRQGIVVEEILPNGAVLSFEGHRFFQHR